MFHVCDYFHSIEDAASGFDPMDSTSAPYPPMTYVPTAGASLEGLRVGVPEVAGGQYDVTSTHLIRSTTSTSCLPRSQPRGTRYLRACDVCNHRVLMPHT